MRQIFKDILNGCVPSIDDFCEELGDILPLLNELMTTDQDEVWHAEGDVHIHTDMVLEELEAMLADEIAWLDDQQRMILVLAAAFHDIAKPLCNRVVERHGRTCLISPNHEEKGRSYLFKRLPSLGLDMNTVIEVCSLVGYHQMPGRLIRSDAADSAFHLLSRQVNVRLLYYLEKADMLGRISDDMERNLEVLELFKMRLEELNLWQEESNPYETWTDSLQPDNELERARLLYSLKDYERGVICSQEEAGARSYKLLNGYSHLVITCGPSGSGKSSWTANLDDSWSMICLDELRRQRTGKKGEQKFNGEILQEARQLLKTYLNQHKKIVWEATSLRRDHRAALVKTAIDYGAIVTIRASLISEEVLYQRNTKRTEPVPVNVLKRQWESYQIPTVDEAHELIFVDEDGKEIFRSPSLRH